ncbi:MAG: hypothetical protein DMG97_17310 [Acidobacteria bacterium]|nr:MAG: hypothetical protein DMG97_17310 [Acidobacteriota bacterium]
MVEVNPSSDSNRGNGTTFTVEPVKHEFNDTSTWEQIIRVLEETSMEASMNSSFWRRSEAIGT